MTTKTQRRRKPAQVAILKALGARLYDEPKASRAHSEEQHLLPSVIDAHRENLIRALLPSLCECTRGGWTASLTAFPSGRSIWLYIDADFRRWRTAQGLNAATESSGTDALSLLVFMRPRLASNENFLRILGLCLLDVLGAAP